MRFLGIITARGGSKSIPKKNIADLMGKPVLYYTIAAALQSKLDDVILSTENEEIANIGRKYKVKVPFMRPKKLSGDNVKHVPVLQYTLKKYEQMTKQKFDYILTLQPTSPLRIAEDIDQAIKLADEQKPDCVVSLEKFTDLSIEKIKYLQDDGKVVSAFVDERGLEGLPRQERKSLYRRNGAIYLTKREVLLSGSVYGDDIVGFEMPAERSIDLNGPIDLELAKFFLEKMNNQK